MPAAPPPTVRAAVLGQAPLLRWALGFGLVTSLLVLVPTLFMLEVYDRVLNSRSLTTLAMLLLMAVWAFVVMELLEVARGAVLSGVAQRVDGALRVRLFDAAMAGTLERGPRAGGVQMFQDLRTVGDFIASPVVGAAMDLPATLVFLALLFIISPLLGVGALVGMGVQALIAWHTERAILPALQAANRSAQEAQVQAAQGLRGAATAQALGMRAGLRQRWLGLQHRMLMHQALASDRNGLSSAASRMLLTLQGSLILGAACWLQLQGAFDGSGGLMIVASTLGGRVLAPLAQLVGQWRSVVEARDAAGRLDAVLAAAPAPAAGMPLPAPTGRLSVEQVLASPVGSTALVLKNLSFVVQPGEVVVCIGPSASGKSTLARVLVGVWPVRAGAVRLDGADVFAWNKDELGPHVGYLGQSVDLFDGTLAENIARFGPVDRALVQAAAHKVGLDAWVQALPDGLDTRLGDGGRVPVGRHPPARGAGPGAVRQAAPGGAG